MVQPQKEAPVSFESRITDRGILRVLIGPVRCVAFSPDGRFFLAGGSVDGCHLYDFSTGNEIVNFYPGRHITAAAFSPDGREVAVGGMFPTIHVYDLVNRKAIGDFETHADLLGGVRAIAYLSKDKLAYAADVVQIPQSAPQGDPRSFIRLWKVKDGIPQIPDGSEKNEEVDTVRTLSYAEQGTVRTVTTELGVHVDVTRPGKRDTITLSRLPSTIRASLLTQDGKTLILACAQGTEFWNAADGGLIRIRPNVAVNDDCQSLAMRADGRLLAIGTAKGDILLFDMEKGQIIKTLQTGHEGVNSIVFHPNGKVLLAGMEDHAVWLQNVSGLP
jgi:WD40 repeat protein